MKTINMPKRIFIYAADVCAITGRSSSYSRRLLRQLRKRNRKKPHALVSVFEFCEYMGLTPEQVEPFLE
ncbi:hypothetical protein A9P82_05790 [Arachidicoccus ginsenosidimutans]|uniref:hypothetical protein n=1 Tax=Arachidicoccus sp. BS20 TaxID=1850526 RepID=UPI0007F1270F|nr:hypothetical protein [Arachidicoccus sp. BS20]ANI90641.1 hypothetical protein A9P82_05790 [Arachidicoccus sp. BS20]